MSVHLLFFLPKCRLLGISDDVPQYLCTRHKVKWVANRLVRKGRRRLSDPYRSIPVPRKTHSYFTQRGWSLLLIDSGLQSILQLFISISYIAAAGGAATGKAGNPPFAPR